LTRLEFEFQFIFQFCDASPHWNRYQNTKNALTSTNFNKDERAGNAGKLYN